MPDISLFLPGTQVLFEIPHLSEARCQTFFRGCRQDHYIILDYPYYSNGVPLPLKDGMDCVVRFIFQGKVYAFQSQVQKAIRYPYPFVFINYPPKLAQINLRSTERYPILIPTVYSERALEGIQEGSLSGQLLDLSESGCLLETDQRFEMETLLFLAFKLSNQDSIMNLAGKVKRISRKEESYHLGLQFVVSEDPDIEKIKIYLSYLNLLRIQT
jgi:c-di-GMP-binding flagellar brake protein YcgR